MEKLKFETEAKLRLKKNAKFGSLQNEDMFLENEGDAHSNPFKHCRCKCEKKSKQKPVVKPKNIFQNWKDKK